MTKTDKSKPQRWHKKLTIDTINKGDPVLNIILCRIGEDKKWRFVFLTSLALLPFIYFALITSKEQRFSLGSLMDSNDYLGMSFMGDTMVWPFFFLVPLLFYFIQQAIGRTVSLLNNTYKNIPQNPESQAQYNQSLNDAKHILLYKGKWRYAYIIAITLGLIFWLYNTVTCYQTDILTPSRNDTRFHAYKTLTPIHIPKSVSVTIEKFSGREQLFRSLISHTQPRRNIYNNLSINIKNYEITWQGPMQTRDFLALTSFSPEPAWQNGIKSLSQQTKGHKELLGKPVNIRKWDTEINEAPLSWFSTRIWVLLLGYGILPLLFLRAGNLLYVIYVFYKRLLDNDTLIIEPLSKDDQRNLHAVTNSVLEISYVLGVFLLCLLLSFAKEGIEADWHNYLLAVPAIPVLLFLFFWPLYTIRKHIRYYKKHELSERAPILDKLYEEVDDITSHPHANNDTNDRLKLLKESIALQESRIKTILSLAEWPLPKHTLKKFTASVILPPLIAIANKLMVGIFGFTIF